MRVTDTVARTTTGNTIRSIVVERLTGTKPPPGSTAALLVETAWASGNPRRARTREILEEPAKALTAAESRTTDHRPHRRVTGVAEGTALAIARHQAAAWAQEIAALFPALPAIVRLVPAVHEDLPASVAGALVVAACVAEAGEGVDKPDQRRINQGGKNEIATLEYQTTYGPSGASADGAFLLFD